MGFDLAKFLAGLQEAKRRARAAALRGCDRFGEKVIGVGQQLAPVDKGVLAASGTTEPAVVVGGQIVKAMGFNTNYAAAVHENLTAKHEQGQAKYLETAMKEMAPKMGPFVSAEIKAEMDG